MKRSTVTKEQRERIEANRQVALQRRNERLRLQNQFPSSNVNNTSNSTTSTKAFSQFPNTEDKVRPVESWNISHSTNNFLSLRTNSNQSQRRRQYGRNSAVHQKSVNHFYKSKKKVVSGYCRLLSRQRFSVVVPYHAQLVDVFRSINSKSFDTKEKTWSFALEDYNTLMKKLKDLRGAVFIDAFPANILKKRSTVTKEQRERIEANRQLALQRRNERLRLQNQFPSSNVNNTSNSTTSTKTFSQFPNTEHKVRPVESWNISHSTNNFLSFRANSNQSQRRRQYGRNSAVHQKSVNHFYKSKKKVVSGYCRLLSRQRFSVVVPYHAQLVDIFRSINSKSFDTKEKTWSFALEDYNTLMKKLKDLRGAVFIDAFPANILKIFRDAPCKQQCFDTMDLSRIDQTLLDALMPFQREGICYGISRNGCCLLADDMGLGKTIQALGIAHYYINDWPLLIVAPSSLRYMWADAIITWLPSISYHSVTIMTSSKDYVKDARILITSYALMSVCLDQLERIRFGVCIMDESHFIKSSESARSKAASVLLKSSKRVLMLSGTPALSRPIELYPQISAINPRLFPNVVKFGKRYCAGVKDQFGWNFSGSSNLEELKLLLEDSVMIRRLKSDVIPELPPKVRQMVILNPGLVVSESREMKKCVKNLDRAHSTDMKKRGALLAYYYTTGSAKLKAIQDYISDILDSDKKFICFAHHKVVLDGICDTLMEKNKEYIRIDGNTNSNYRKILCDKFQYEEKYVAAVLSITVANAGFTLTAAHLVVFAELYWNPGILTQAEDRAHRIGQDDCVLIQYLVAKRTADDYIWPLIQNKLNVLNKASLSNDNLMSTETTLLQNSNKPSILNFFEDMSPLEDTLADNDQEDLEVQGKRAKLHTDVKNNGEQ
ncbi:SWI/SNF-related matrix-associated actin-dependent regulator of chromatin subfamily A-like protein 1 isoform X5 [Periplaneta americana]|uniref:SWI/SNF-related matrix-associated actin-dependent regulator of chromatin subfamily A-like protein 1 isoform X5 n=1 Tax=Periplaneta americana TaxID=6978 RepID=UPI0037E907D3